MISMVKQKMLLYVIIIIILHVLKTSTFNFEYGAILIGLFSDLLVIFPHKQRPWITAS